MTSEAKDAQALKPGCKMHFQSVYASDMDCKMCGRGEGEVCPEYAATIPPPAAAIVKNDLVARLLDWAKWLDRDVGGTDFHEAAFAISSLTDQVEARTVDAYTYKQAMKAYFSRAIAAEMAGSRLTEQVEGLRNHVKILQEKIDPDEHCACGYDAGTDVCLHHSPIVHRLTAENEKLTMERDALLQGVRDADAIKEAIVTRLRAENETLREALEPSEETKYAYIGKFTIAVERIVNEDEEPIDGADVPDPYDHIQVPWTTIKQIMAAIRARATLSNTSQPRRLK